MRYRDCLERAAMIAVAILSVVMILVAFRTIRLGEPLRSVFAYVPAGMILSAMGGLAISLFLEWSTGSAHSFYAGGNTEPRVILDLSRIRTHIKREEWDAAKSELARQWADYPGNGDLLREWERFYLDGLGAPSGMVGFLEAQMPVLVGDDRAYAMLRLAEVHADTLHEKGCAILWCQRLLAGYPSSPFAPQAKALLDSLTGGAKS